MKIIIIYGSTYLSVIFKYLGSEGEVPGTGRGHVSPTAEGPLKSFINSSEGERLASYTDAIGRRHENKALQV